MLSDKSNLYWIICKQCGYRSQDSWQQDHAQKLRQLHINMKGCNDNSVALALEMTELSSEMELQPPQPQDGIDWMYDCLDVAKGILLEHHRHYDGTENCDLDKFFSESTFELFIQKDRPYAYAYINANNGTPYPIGINYNFVTQTAENERMLHIVLVHELLHAIHPDWGHNKITPEERKLANISCHYDAIHNMEIMYLSGKMRYCDV